MAITQSRMIELLKIAETLKDQIFFTRDFIEELCRELPPEPSTEQFWTFIHAMQNFGMQLTIGPKALETLAIEGAHFKQNATKNARQAMKQRIRRGKDPEAAPQPTAPLTMRRRTFGPTQAPSPTPSPAPSPVPFQMPDLNETLIKQKLEINKLYEDKKMKVPYLDPFDDSTPLEPDHLRALGQAPDDDGELF